MVLYRGYDIYYGIYKNVDIVPTASIATLIEVCGGSKIKNKEALANPEILKEYVNLKKR